MSDTPHPEPDRIDGAPHPRETQTLYGQDEAQAEFLRAFASDRLHHGWLVTGPRGVGKATLAWRIARFLLATPPADDDGLFGAPPAPTDLSVPDDHPVARRMMAGSEPGLFVLRRPFDEKAKRLKAQITVDEVRKLKGFFALSATDGGRRVVIIDATDDMNVNAANAILKLLEEPPARTTLLLVSHQPSRLLPTIRSRCRELRLGPLSPSDMAQALSGIADDKPGSQTDAMAALSGGSVGEAVRLVQLDGLKLYADIVQLLSSLPDLSRPHAIALAESAAGRGKEDRLDLMLTLLDRALSRLARTGATGQPPEPAAAPREAETFQRLCPTPEAARVWAHLAQQEGDRLRHGRAVNVETGSLLLASFLALRDGCPR
ncbi:DNA polymerase III subunit delta' [Marivita hallyeonensis]|uniref:DNA polymerase III, delta prime subunit n=1 Tax=Marivita hallyeonensis TaxID=996342 RepID=A0A1M5W1V4_9RHOB|nr:DNA polymerase III subunit delta' [Marivita hallyeonensis]SHH81204.1 DNA polymerase III, delta prime subunit [Marivita hallyeonensis]